MHMHMHIATHAHAYMHMRRICDAAEVLYPSTPPTPPTPPQSIQVTLGPMVLLVQEMARA